MQFDCNRIKAVDNLIWKTEDSIIFRYGSMVYGTNGPQSDEDFVMVGPGVFPFEGDVQQYTLEEFQTHLNTHNIMAMECVFLDPDFVFTEMDRVKVRGYCAAVSSNAWAKAKKKLDASSPDYAPYIGKKSAFHSLRVAEVGIQILNHGRIVDYSAMNHLYDTIQSYETFDEIKAEFHGMANSLRSELRRLAPK